MSPKDVLKNTIDTCAEILDIYVSDLSDNDLLTRCVPETNHAAWQLGHLISSEHDMLSDAGFNMPALPDGFAESYTKESSTCDDASKFLSKDQYIELIKTQRSATFDALTAVPEGDLDKPSPEQMREYAPTIGVVFNIVGVHIMMHAAQFVPLRRKLGKPVLI